MGKLTMTLSEFPLPESLSSEMQALADMIMLPETLLDAERILTPEMFSDEACGAAYSLLRRMSKEKQIIDMPSVFGKIDQDLLRKGIMPMMQNVGGAVTAVQHYQALKDISVKRKCYFKGMQLLMESTDANVSSQDIINHASHFAEELRKEIDADKGTQHISEVLSEVGETLEVLQRERQEGKILRVPTGFKTLDFYTYGGFNAGNLVILAARPSVGKTAVMLHMAKAAARAGKAVNVYSLEMTNQELGQRFLASESTGLSQWAMAKGNVEWQLFEKAVGSLSTHPIYLNDSARTLAEITSRITLNAMAGKCDIAFIDYLGLIKLYVKGGNLSQAIAECTGDLKALAKACRIPIVLLCQLNRASASEKRPPEMYDLRDSGGIEQDADIVLMLERASDDEDGREVNMWVRKNRQGKAGNISVTIVANETYSAFVEKGEEYAYPSCDDASDEGADDAPRQQWYDFENDTSEFPF